MGAVNFVSINRKLEEAIKRGAKSREITSKLRDGAEKGATLLVARMQKEFDFHPVTSSLKRGPSGKNTLIDFPDYGNLVAYFGLDSGTIGQDLATLRDLLSARDVTVKRNGDGSYSIRIRFNPLSVYYASTPAQGYKGSWLKAMEQALLRNFTKFLFREDGIENSRSGTGIQVKKTLKRGIRSPSEIPYITDIYNKVLSNVNIGKKILASAIKKSK